MLEKEKIYFIHNLPSGGGMVYLDKIRKILSEKYLVITLKPKSKLSKGWLNYLLYAYFRLPLDYLKILSKIRNNKTVIFQDFVLRAPPLLAFMPNKFIYVLHEPPREFYEPINLHAPFIKDKIFNILRAPIFFLDKICTCRAKIIISNSKFSSKIIKKIYKRKSVVLYPASSVLNNNIENISTRANRCISVGNFLPYKGHSLAITSISLVPLNKRPNLVIVGSGRKMDKDILLKLAKRKKVKIFFKSNLSNTELLKEYRRSKIYINCAYKEPFGIAALEAVENGCNLITVNNCGTTEIANVYKNKSIIVDRKQINIAKAISEMLGKENIANNNKYFCWEKTGKKLIKLLKNEHLSY